ncbi:hypothetical protein ABEB36_001904 [Hypothenemus hampei]|uniref:tRNA-specific adenosine deaminase 1 n=1 Tax=Hypothenemus hampei TaxID=57062 RepID=A0ABD1FG44_HYPHA
MNNNMQLKIAKLSLEKFDTLPKTGKPQENEWTVLSSIIKEENEQFYVVSLGTGSKCIGKTKMCPNGSIVNDGHAEIMCRRAFLRYLYSQLCHNSQIFTFNKEIMKFSLKTGIKFHFFTTHVPCGDAAIIEQQSINSDQVGPVIPDLPPKKKAKFCQTGAKRVAQNPVQDFNQDVGLVRTKPGRGDPTGSVSCSDKLAKWCHLGIQGALLMFFLECPVYLSSFTILNENAVGEEALKRALYTRLNGNIELKGLFKRHLMEFCWVDLAFFYKKKDETKPCATSMAWLEIGVNGRKQGVTKKHLVQKGRLGICRLELFKLFKEKLALFNVIQIKDDISYGQMKSLSEPYQANWKILKRSFSGWPIKNPNLMDFSV